MALGALTAVDGVTVGAIATLVRRRSVVCTRGRYRLVDCASVVAGTEDHARVLRALDRNRVDDTAPERVARVARVVDVDRAAALLARAARGRLKQGLVDEAVALGCEAIDLAVTSASTAALGAASLALRAAGARQPLAGVERVQPLLAHASGLARGRLRREIVPLLLRAAQVDTAEREARAGLLDVGSSDVELAAWLSAGLAEAREAKGDVAGAVDILVAAFQTLGGGSVREPDFYWENLNLLGRLYARAGETAQAATFVVQARAQAERVGSVVGVVKSLINQAGLAATGDRRRALALLDEAVALAVDAADLVGAARACFNRGIVLRDDGDRAGASIALNEALRHARSAGWREGEALALAARRDL